MVIFDIVVEFFSGEIECLFLLFLNVILIEIVVRSGWHGWWSKLACNLMECIPYGLSLHSINHRLHYDYDFYLK